MTDDAMDAVLIELARRKAERGIRIMDAVFDDFGFGWRANPAYGTEIARQARAIGPGTSDFGADLAGIALAVFTHFGHPHDPAEVRAVVRRHLSGPGH